MKTWVTQISKLSNLNLIYFPLSVYSVRVECGLTHEDSFPPKSNHLAVNSTPKHSVLFSNFPTPMMLWTLENPGCCRGRLNLPPRIITDSHYCKQCLCVSVCVNGGFMIIAHFPWAFSFVSLWNVISHSLLFVVFLHNFSVLFEFFNEPPLSHHVSCNAVFVCITALIICCPLSRLMLVSHNNSRQRAKSVQ